MFSIDTNALWQYSLSVYKHEEVKAACLELQDMMDINVNLIILMMYLCRHQLMFNFDDIKLIEEAIKKSEQMLKRHRAKRRGIKQVSLALYQEALAQELLLEKAQQEEMVEFANTLFFHYVRSPNELPDQLAGLCLRKLTDTRTKRPYKFDYRKVSDDSLKACAVLGKYV